VIPEGQRIYSPWEKPDFAEVEFFFIIHHPKFVIPPALSEVEGTGGTAVLAVPERRYGSPSHAFCAMNLSSTLDFGLSARTNRPEGVTLETVRDASFTMIRASATTEICHSDRRDGGFSRPGAEESLLNFQSSSLVREEISFKGNILKIVSACLFVLIRDSAMCH